MFGAVASERIVVPRQYRHEAAAVRTQRCVVDVVRAVACSLRYCFSHLTCATWIAREK